MTAKRILILAERFYPEEFLINDLAATWQARGFEVEVLTQVPSYPHDRIFCGYRNRLLQTTREFHDIPVHRVRTALGYNRGMKHKIVNYVNFTFWTSLWALCNGWRYDRIFAFHSGPLSMAGAGLVFRFLWFRRCMIWTQDVWPDTVYNYGVKPTLAMRFFLISVVRTIYLAYAEISVSCPGFIERLKSHTGKKVHYFPQWTNHAEALPAKPRGGKLTFTFAGNIGSVQNLELVVRAFGELRRSDAELVIVGGGIYLERLQRLVAENHYRNIILPGRKPQTEMPKYFAEADVLIISLKPEFDLTVPAKFQAYIAAGRPVLGLVRGDTAALIAKHDLGMTADPADEAAIRAVFIAMCDSPAKNFVRWRENALSLSQKEFNRETIIEKMTAALIHASPNSGEKL